MIIPSPFGSWRQVRYMSRAYSSGRAVWGGATPIEDSAVFVMFGISHFRAWVVAAPTVILVLDSGRRSAVAGRSTAPSRKGRYDPGTAVDATTGTVVAGLRKPPGTNRAGLRRPADCSWHSPEIIRRMPVTRPEGSLQPTQANGQVPDVAEPARSARQRGRRHWPDGLIAAGCSAREDAFRRADGLITRPDGFQAN